MSTDNQTKLKDMLPPELLQIVMEYSQDRKLKDKVIIQLKHCTTFKCLDCGDDYINVCKCTHCLNCGDTLDECCYSCYCYCGEYVLCISYENDREICPGL